MAKSQRITVFAGRHESGCYNWSPFVNKLQARLRFASVAYDITASSLSQAPKGKIPYIGLSSDTSRGDSKPTEPPTLLGDTDLITKHLMEIGDLPNLNEVLAPVELAQDLALRALLEDKIYFMQVMAELISLAFYWPVGFILISRASDSGTLVSQ